MADIAAQVEELVEEEVADQLEDAIDAAEARAEAAEEALEAIADSARRDALHDEIVSLRGECTTWQEAQDARVRMLETQLSEARSELQALRDQMAELQKPALTVATVSTPEPSPENPIPEPEVTVQTVDPENAAPAVIVEKPEARANQRRWI
jgi:hypothetical protein